MIFAIFLCNFCHIPLALKSSSIANLRKKKLPKLLVLFSLPASEVTSLRAYYAQKKKPTFFQRPKKEPIE